MKTQILITVFLGLMLGACSSSKKSTNDATTTTEAQAEKAADKAKETADKTEKAANEGVSVEATCKLGGDTRTIGVKSVDKGCEVIYTKFGESTSVASGSQGSDHCANVVTKIKENLQNAGFTCE